MTEYQIDLHNVRTLEDFVSAVNAGMIDSVGGHWHGNLDAFNDYLYWPEPHPYRLTSRGWAECSTRLAGIHAPCGRPILTVIAEIFRHNPHVIVKFE